MNLRVLPEEVLLARLPVHQYRAWSRAWGETTRALFQGSSPSTESIEVFARLTGTPVDRVAQARASSERLEAMLALLAPEWARRALEHDGRCHVSKLPGEMMGVELPVDEEGLRHWLLRLKQREQALNGFVTQDIQLLSQLQVALEHARSQQSVLITGETGTGKGALAKAIHVMSGRKNFVPINCTAIPAGLIESELFGSKRGAFTGAQDKPGLVAEAENGTLFLDEVGDLASEVQPKLLRMLREREYRSVGDTQPHHTQARFIAATNASLFHSVAEGRFREDLLQRLSACHIELPPLRNRPGDILLIAEHVLKEQKHSGALTEPVRTLMNRYDWMGNVAELADAMRYAAVASQGEPIRIAHLPDILVAQAYPPAGTASQIILTAQVLSSGDTSELQDTFPEALDAVLQEASASPPPVTNNQEVDELVAAFVQLAFLWPGNTAPLTPVALEKALDQLRTVSLLAELRQQLSTGNFPRAVTDSVHSRLNAELQDVKGPPLLGMAIQVLMQLLGSDEPNDRSALLEWALKFQKVVPLIVHVAQAIQRNTRDEPPPVTALTVRPAKEMHFTRVPGTSDWLDKRNHPVVERAIRRAEGVKQRAGELLQIRSTAHVTKVIREHGLEQLCTDLTQARRAGRRTAKGGDRK
ncbi:sigma 54-interacting transcriptional regulator [Stigmatella aurantiaca]|uniref:Sigma-54 dependent transcriptional regulator n=1 Tax=Stigmatella aurantiaca (strain DW4/3-1) TaxID=378806 RepID=E3FKD8_STIAD|nr:sigma 54-interacting transcriptional regulator [Stigmatella aurantiaca]ADO67911.1 Sigma-54 dependent transcriptional regulator [Stigmatella aurantiaca DW4/3-1]